MCGIAGWVDYAGLPPEAEAVVGAMGDAQERRGPDGSGTWASQRACLAHRRLSVIDIEGGAQPMRLQTEGLALTLTYNGEIYNYRELRDELAARGHTFRTRSDTEVLLAAWAEWGHGAIERLNGMFAFALWDEGREELWLVRDRLGVKPLCYRHGGDSLLFASEAKGLLRHPDVRPTIDAEGMTQLLLPLIKFPGTNPYRDIAELPPGHAAVFSRNGLRLLRYWDLENIIARAPRRTGVTEAGASLRDLLHDTIGRQTIADVPLCTLLSGGLDSSAITAIAQGQAGGRVRSFSVDFDDAAGSATSRSALDRAFAQEAAAFIGCDHRNIVLDSARLADRATRESCVSARDLPNGIGDLDLSLFLLCREVREHATVALSGESADEILAGYLWFHEPAAVSADTFPWLADSPAHGRLHQRILAAFAPGLTGRLRPDAYLTERYREALARLDLDLDPSLTAQERRHREIMYLAITHFLPSLLERNDRLSMASGLEVRVPFCDHRIVEHLVTLPSAVHTADGREKSVLREAARSVLPTGVLERKKSPYPSVPDPAYADRVSEQIAAIPPERRIALQELFDPALLDTGGAGRGSADGLISNIEAELVLNFDAWFRLYDPQLAF